VEDVSLYSRSLVVIHYAYLAKRLEESLVRGRGCESMVDEDTKETLDLILNNLREFERDFQRLIGEFQKIGDNSNLSEDMAEKFKDAKKRLLSVQKDISNVVESLPASAPTISPTTSVMGPPIIIRCKNWIDFKLQASKADNISFLYREEEKAFQVDAVKGSRVYTYSGQLPNGEGLLRTWLSSELGTKESQVSEGVLALG